jgi:hypothetical protein
MASEKAGPMYIPKATRAASRPGRATVGNDSEVPSTSLSRFSHR